NPCTVDSCEGDVCIHTPHTYSCDDDDTCTENDTCSGGACVGTAVDCDDEDPCTINDHCDPQAGCVSDPLCDDGDPCTTDTCDSDTGECEHEDMWPPYDSCSPLGCVVQMDVPDLIFVNDDDDNGDGVADYLDSESVDGEDDLHWISLTTSGCAPLPECILDASTYTWNITAWWSGLYFCLNSDNTDRVVSSRPWPPPAGFYLAGHGSSPQSCGCPAWFSVVCGSAAHSCEAETTPVIVVKTASLEWEKGASGNPPLDDCLNNGGKRIFPGKIDPQDPSPDDRKKVKLVATINPPISGVTVYFKVWDVDDPFDQLHSDMPDVSLIDGNTTGPDNRGSGPAESPQTATTDEDGKATVTFTVFTQPGDNYRAGASVLEDAINQATQATADALNQNGGSWSGYSVPLVWSQMLTVWRKLHVETDSMTRPTFAENTIDALWNQPRWDDPPFPPQQLVLDVTSQPSADDFENGFIRIKATGFEDIVTRIIGFRHSAGDDEVGLAISAQQWGDRPTEGNWPCTFSDDDLYEEANFLAGVVGSDIGVGNPPNGHLPLPDTSRLAHHYEPAYILPVVEAEHTSLTGIAFVKNIENIEDEAAWTPILPVHTLAISTPEYWTAYVYSAFQAESSEDFDGEVEATKGINANDVSVFGDVKPYGKWGPQYTGMCAIFAEAVDDGFGEAELRIAVAHEIAHALGVDHSSELMHEKVQKDSFGAQSLVELRTYAGP
ncbi:MAG: hypothetical protein WBE26_08710, partial [Phycisphaerae bacterium]